ncbi:MAG: hypothetical protein WAZ94_00490 [Phycisphaerales bacterium]
MRCQLRSACKWGGTVLTILLLVLWVGSDKFCVVSGSCYVTNGVLVLEWLNGKLDLPSIPDLSLRKAEARFYWRFGIYRAINLDSNGSYLTILHIPIWSMALLVAAPTIWFWFRGRRRSPGLCASCGYDLRGADHDLCPECGAPPPQPSPAKPGEGVGA